uniref:beta-mannosidase n=1 Tax=Glossina brevipalpis TaxID=37001 RepID=A0A1A9W1B3_9MUSC
MFFTNIGSNYLILSIVLLWFLLGLKCDADRVLVINLNRNWTLSNQNESIQKSRFTIPSGVYSQLYGEKVLDSYNDVNLRWISHDNWTYTNIFSVKTDECKRFVNLTLHGIDTIAEVRLNHYLLGRPNNMFVRYSYDITKILQEHNILEIEIKSPIYAALNKAKDLQDQGMDTPPNCPPSRYEGECHMNMLRKMQASFAWDWGLAAPSMGIWKSIALEYYDAAVIRDVDVTLTKNSTHWTMQSRVFIDCNSQSNFYAELTFYAVELLKNPLIIDKHSKTPISCKAAIITFDVDIPIDQVTLWWPNGYGDQKLYPLHYSLKAWINSEGPNLRDKIKSEKSIRIGFRTIELVEDAVTEGTGNTFFFKVNDKEIFMKGSNYIPSHILPEYSRDTNRCKSTQILMNLIDFIFFLPLRLVKHLLQSAKDTHQNMIRVWGGGIYESDEFYDIADQNGLLIWHDMMFACAMYPITEEFLASVRLEISQNAKRIAHHPSIAIFATNNENEVALVQGWYNTGSDEERFRKEYRELYLATIMHELKIIEHSSRPTALVSSPSNGKVSANDNYISNNPQDPNYGDVHFYDTFSDAWDPIIYPRPRFASEYGFQGLPQLMSWLKTKGKHDELLYLIRHRQHHPAGMLVITSLVRRHLPLPLPDQPLYVEALIYFSQIAQAMATKIETELYRSLRDTEHRTMGALYWQLNDVWVAPSWSAIDFYGNYKLLHYWSQDFLAPTSIIALYDSENKAINVSLVCDEFEVDTNELTVTLNSKYMSDRTFKRVH